MPPPEIQFPDEIFPLTETLNDDPIVVVLQLNRVAGIRIEDNELKIEFKSMGVHAKTPLQGKGKPKRKK